MFKVKQFLETLLRYSDHELGLCHIIRKHNVQSSNFFVPHKLARGLTVYAYLYNYITSWIWPGLEPMVWRTHLILSWLVHLLIIRNIKCKSMLESCNKLIASLLMNMLSNINVDHILKSIINNIRVHVHFSLLNLWKTNFFLKYRCA